MNKNRILMVAALVFATFQLSAQNPKSYKITTPEPAFGEPYTTVKVYVVVEKETVRKGPYARFAERYMGVMAPLNDKDIYTIKDARIDYVDPDRKGGLMPGAQSPQRASGKQSLRPGQSGGSVAFPKVPVNRVSATERSLEDMARDAANTIFMLRKRRIELITGEAGENVYGEGLRAALAEMQRLEDEYVALFMGKQSVTRSVEVVDVIPETGKTNYIAFRFSADGGLLPDSDLSGTPVVLNLAPENSIPEPQGKLSGKSFDYYRIADFVQCTLSGPSGEIAKARIPVYQFGCTVVFPVQ